MKFIHLRQSPSHPPIRVNVSQIKTYMVYNEGGNYRSQMFLQGNESELRWIETPEEIDRLINTAGTGPRPVNYRGHRNESGTWTFGAPRSGKFHGWVFNKSSVDDHEPDAWAIVEDDETGKVWQAIVDGITFLDVAPKP